MHGKNLFVAGNMDHVRLYDFGKENAAPVQSTVRACCGNIWKSADFHFDVLMAFFCENMFIM